MGKEPVWIVGSLREVAEFFGVHLSTVKGEWRGSGMPGKAGEWNLKEILAWRDGRRAAAKSPASGENTITVDGQPRSLNQLAALEAFERYRLRKLRNDRLAGELVSRTDVEQSAAELVARLRERFEAVPDELQMEFPAKQRAQWRLRLESKVRLILTELASWGDEVTNEQRTQGPKGPRKSK